MILLELWSFPSHDFMNLLDCDGLHLDPIPMNDDQMTGASQQQQQMSTHQQKRYENLHFRPYPSNQQQHQTNKRKKDIFLTAGKKIQSILYTTEEK